MSQSSIEIGLVSFKNLICTWAKTPVASLVVIVDIVRLHRFYTKIFLYASCHFVLETPMEQIPSIVFGLGGKVQAFKFSETNFIDVHTIA